MPFEHRDARKSTEIKNQLTPELTPARYCSRRNRRCWPLVLTKMAKKGHYPVTPILGCEYFRRILHLPNSQVANKIAPATDRISSVTVAIIRMKWNFPSSSNPFLLKLLPVLFSSGDYGDSTNALLCFVHALIAINKHHHRHPERGTHKRNMANGQILHRNQD